MARIALEQAHVVWIGRREWMVHRIEPARLWVNRKHRKIGHPEQFVRARWHERQTPRRVLTRPIQRGVGDVIGARDKHHKITFHKLQLCTRLIGERLGCRSIDDSVDALDANEPARTSALCDQLDLIHPLARQSGATRNHDATHAAASSDCGECNAEL